MKKIFTIILILIFFQSCGYVPMYSKNQNVNFFIESVDFQDSDRELANFIKINLNNYLIKNTGIGFRIKSTINYQKITTNKNTEGIIEEYDLIANASFQVTSENIDKTINISEAFKMGNFSDEFQEKEYENNIKKNMARSIITKLLIQLAKYNAG